MTFTKSQNSRLQFLSFLCLTAVLLLSGSALAQKPTSERKSTPTKIRLPKPKESANAMFDCPAISPDGKLAVFGCNRIDGIGRSYEGDLYFWDVSQKKLIRTITGFGDPISALAFSPDGKTLAVGVYDRLLLVSVDSGKREEAFKTPLRIMKLAFSKENDLLGIATGVPGEEKGELILWSPASRKSIFTLPMPGGGVIALDFYKDRVAGGAIGNIRIWSTTTGEEIKRIAVSQGREPHSLSFNSTGKQIAFGAHKTLNLYDVESGRLVKSLPHVDWVNNLFFASDGSIKTIGTDGELLSWNTNSNEKRVLAQTPIISTGVFSATGEFAIMLTFFDGEVSFVPLASQLKEVKK